MSFVALNQFHQNLIICDCDWLPSVTTNVQAACEPKILSCFNLFDEGLSGLVVRRHDVALLRLDVQLQLPYVAPQRC